MAKAKKKTGIDWQAKAMAAARAMKTSNANMIEAAQAAIKLDKHNRLLRRVIGKMVMDVGGEIRVPYRELATALDFGMVVEDGSTADAVLVIAVVEAPQAPAEDVLSVVQPSSGWSVGQGVNVKRWLAIDPLTGKVRTDEEPIAVHWPGIVREILDGDHAGELVIECDSDSDAPFNCIQVSEAWIEASTRVDTLSNAEVASFDQAFAQEPTEADAVGLIDALVIDPHAKLLEAAGDQTHLDKLQEATDRREAGTARETAFDHWDKATEPAPGQFEPITVTAPDGTVTEGVAEVFRGPVGAEVSTDTLTPEEIAIARAEDRLRVDADGLGYVTPRLDANHPMIKGALEQAVEKLRKV